MYPILFLIPIVNSLQYYKSTLTLLESEKNISGLHLQNTVKNPNTSSFSISIRLHFNRLGRGNDARVFDLSWPEGSVRPFLYVYARYPYTWMSFGHYEHHENDTFVGYIISENDPPDYLVWATNRWHHLCLAFDKANHKISIVKVSHALLFPVFLSIEKVT